MIRLQKRLRRQAGSPAPSGDEGSAESRTALVEMREANGRLARLLEEEKNARAGDLDRMAQQAEKEIAQRVSDARRELDLEFAERKRTDRKISNTLSRGALLAKVMEHVGPLVPEFPYNLKECRHVGEIFDYLVYENLESDPNDLSIVFLEVKTSSTGRQRRVTNPRERALRQAIKAGRVRYEVWQPPTDAQLSEKLQRMVDDITPKEIDAPLDSQ